MQRILFAGIVMACCCVCCIACKSGNKEATQQEKAPLFTLLTPEQTGVDFSNRLTEGLNTNVLMYEYFYNGGGVAVGDLNGDGLDDIYFTANMADNKLYLNRGQMKFEDITAAAGVEGRPGPWKTGVAMADVDGDGLLDIYLCYSGKTHGERRVHQLFINEGNDKNGIPRFSEKAKEFGLADSSYASQAYFFDMDHDGDLDLLMLNHNPNAIAIQDEATTAATLAKDNPMMGLRLFRNDNNHFVDVTGKAGLSSSSLSYGLGAGIADINGDGWDDIYVSNDYAVPDYLYINDHNGHFTDRLGTSMGHTSEFSMGNDVADVNNDGLPDILTLDMLPEDNHRQKLLFAPDNYEKFDLNVRTGFHHQYMRNMLQMNNGNGTFSETGQMAGISNTDWSWAPLMADYDNDGWKDIFVTNGYLRDFTNLDFIKYMNDYLQSKGRLRREDVLELVKQIPSSNVASYLFRNDTKGGFANMSSSWGIRSSSNSNGAAYADLDNDGDLDLVVNNINQPAFIYENNSNSQTRHHYLRIKLQGAGKNTQGIGARVVLWNKGRQQYFEQMPVRGYLSSVSPILHAGLDSAAAIDSLVVIWPGGMQQVLKNVKADQLLTLDEKNATLRHVLPAASPRLFTEAVSPLKRTYAATTLNDFKRQPLMVNPLSFSGPCLVKGDVNGDGLEDVYAGGSNGEPAALFIQEKNGQFVQKPQPAFEADRQSEDADAVFFDANGDGYTDIYVASGGYHNYAADDVLLQDRLYLNDGKGNFTKSAGALPSMRVSKSCVRVNDINHDGHPDLFVGGRVIPGRYPETPPSYLLINDGHGHFTDQIASLAPTLQKMGMVTDALWIDLNNDKKNDLVVIGEWMPVSVFVDKGGKLENETKSYFDKEYAGWWNKLAAADINGDGHADLIIGNMGLNTQCKASDQEPAEMYYKDFDANGAIDPVFCFYIQGKSWPYITRDELLDQMSMMRGRFTDYKSYADASLQQVFAADELHGAGHLKANYLQTALFVSDAAGKYHVKSLPMEAQISPVFTITVLDYDKDGHDDLLLCGNINHARLRFGKYDASYGVLLKGDGKGGFGYVPQRTSGFRLLGDVRSVVKLNNILLFGINQQPVKAYRFP